jgi:hypothetical protein
VAIDLSSDHSPDRNLVAVEDLVFCLSALDSVRIAHGLYQIWLTVSKTAIKLDAF